MADIKDTLSAAISDLRLDIHAIAHRVHEVERITAQHDTVLRQVTHKVDAHTLQLRDLQGNMEDLDNRGRSHNLHVCGLPESVETEQLTATVTGLFNLLDKPAQTAVEMEWIHLALRPKGRETDPPRNVVCCLIDYKLKEEILKKAQISTYTSITLQHRRDLKTLLDTLRSKGIHLPPLKVVRHHCRYQRTSSPFATPWAFQ